MIARGFLEAGAKVYISSRKKEVCDDVAQQFSEAGECISLAADVSRAAGCELAKEIAAREPKLHILMSGRSLGRNAGRLSRNRV